MRISLPQIVSDRRCGLAFRAIREHADVSQEVFAHYLNVTKSSVSKWERGEKRPAGPALKLLILVEKNGLEAVA